MRGKTMAMPENGTKRRGRLAKATPNLCQAEFVHQRAVGESIKATDTNAGAEGASP
jgi:hypothetical protein